MKKILVGLGSTHYADTASRHAMELAGRFGAQVTAIAVLDRDRLANTGPVPLGGSAAAEDLRAHRLERAAAAARQAIARFESECVQAQVRHTSSLVDGDPVKIFADLARYHDLFICGAHPAFDFGVLQDEHRDPTSHLVPLVHHGVRPILAVPETFQPVHRVAIAYHGSMEAARAMHQYAQLNPWPRAELHLISVGDDIDRIDRELDGARDYLREYGLAATPHRIPGAARKQLLPAIEQIGAQILVMGNSNRNVILERLFGDTLGHVLEQSEIGVFLSQ